MNRDHKIINGNGLMKFSRPSLYSVPTKAFTKKRDNTFSDRSVHLKHILIVDDDPSIAELLGNLLTEWGYVVFYALNGQEGLQMVERHLIDGILLDLEMPVMDGRTMLDELRWRNDHVPVIVMSGGVSVESMRSLLREGAQGFLPKPFPLEGFEKICIQIFGASHRGKAWVPFQASIRERNPCNAALYSPIQSGNRP